MIHLWRYNATTGYWALARSCTPEDAARWLEIWRRDEPKVSFVLAKRRPRKSPKR